MFYHLLNVTTGNLRVKCILLESKQYICHTRSQSHLNASNGSSTLWFDGEQALSTWMYSLLMLLDLQLERIHCEGSSNVLPSNIWLTITPSHGEEGRSAILQPMLQPRQKLPGELQYTVDPVSYLSATKMVSLTWQAYSATYILWSYHIIAEVAT